MRASVKTISKRIILAAFSALWRNRFSALFFSFSLSLLFLFFHLLSFGGFFSQAIIQNFEKKVDVPVIMDQEADSFQVDIFRKALIAKKKNGEILDFWEISETDAMEEFQERYPAEISFIEHYNIENPFVVVFGIIPLPDPFSGEYLESWILSEKWNGIVDQYHFRKNAKQHQRISRFLSLTSFSDRGILSLQIFVGTIASLLIFYAAVVTTQSHQKEISIMRLVGARLSFIRLPFLIEGFFLSLFALILSFFFFWIFLSIFSFWITNILHELNISFDFLTVFFHESSLFLEVIFPSSFFLFFLFIFSSFLGVERALQKNLLSDL
jgi:cell division protein FtsX